MTPLQFTLDQFVVFVLVLTRVSGLLMTAPVFGSQSLPVRVRALLAVGLSLIVTPWFWGTSPPATPTLVHLSLMVAREAMLGLAIGFAVLLMFSGIQLAGTIMGQMSGVQLADVIDPTFDASVPIFSRMLDLVAVTVFLLLGGHRQLMGALLDSFHWLPPGRGELPPTIVESLTELTVQSFVIGLRVAAPSIVALLASVLITGLLYRTLPQLNILSIGFSLNIIALFAVLIVSLGTAVYVFEDELLQTIDRIHTVVNPASP